MEKDYYKTMGISKGATDDEIKKAYKTLALKYHPDKNKSPQAEELFKALTEAYEILRDKKKREIYDQQAEEALKRGARTWDWGSDCDPWSNFWYTNLMEGLRKGTNPPTQNCNAQASQQKRQPTVQDPTIEHDLYVSLEDIYKGCTKQFKITRNVWAPNGSKRKEDKVLTIKVKPGWKCGTKVTFPKEGDQTTGNIPADIVFIVRDKPHKLFKRLNSTDIKYQAKVSLKKALCGTTIRVPTLEGGKIPLTLRGIKPTTNEKIPGKGLPFVDEPSRRGNLRVSFDIQYPSLSSADKQRLLESDLLE